MNQDRCFRELTLSFLESLSAFLRPYPWLAIAKEDIERMEHGCQVGQNFAIIVYQSEERTKVLAHSVALVPPELPSASLLRYAHLVHPPCDPNTPQWPEPRAVCSD